MRKQPSRNRADDSSDGGSTRDEAKNIFLKPPVEQIEVVKNEENKHPEIKEEIRGKEGPKALVQIESRKPDPETKSKKGRQLCNANCRARNEPGWIDSQLSTESS